MATNTMGNNTANEPRHGQAIHRFEIDAWKTYLDSDELINDFFLSILSYRNLFILSPFSSFVSAQIAQS